MEAPGPPAGGLALSGVVVYVACAHPEQRLALVSRLRSLGAQIASRVHKQVSHVVFAGLPAAQRAQEDAELRELFDRAHKVRARSRDRPRRAAPRAAPARSKTNVPTAPIALRLGRSSSARRSS
jgi:hypothetical protein